MKTINLIQGTPEWHAFRATHFTASDAPAMMGVSPYKTRIDLLKEKKYGITKEVDAATQRRFDDGHRFEELARVRAEKAIQDELFPVVGVSDEYQRIAASFDGITMDESVIFEHKTLNAEIAACSDSKDLPAHYRAQMEQQLLVSGAEKCLFVASKWNDDNSLEDEHGFWYYSDKDLRQKIIAGWAQFEKDLADFELPESAKPEIVGTAPDMLPTLVVSVKGEVVSSNLDAFRSKALAVFDSIKTDLSSDEDFASAEKAVKWCKDVEGRCEATKEQVIGQMASIEEVTRTLTVVQERARQTRLVLEKAVKTQKDSLRASRIAATQEKYHAHLNTLNATRPLLILPPHPDFVGAIKGLKTLSSIDAALDSALAQAKIAASEWDTNCRNNLEWYGENANGFESLFHDLTNLVQESAEQFQMTVNYRIDQAKKAEAERMEAEREKIRKEEQAKIEAEAQRQKIREEQAANQPTVTETVSDILPAKSTELVAALFDRVARLTESETEMVIHYADRLLAHRKEAA